MLVEEAIVDAYGEPEQRVGFLCMLQEHLACPFTTEILGQPVRVERIDWNDAEEIVAVCRRQRHRQLIPILNLPVPSPPPTGWEWIEPIVTGLAAGDRPDVNQFRRSRTPPSIPE
jgi:calcium binding protein